MFTVVLALDASPTSGEAVAFAQRLLAGHEIACTLLHVIPSHNIYSKAGGGSLETYDLPDEKAASGQLLERYAQALRAANIGPHIEQVVMVGDEADEILVAAEERDADLIILGSRGLHAPRRFLVGSVSTKVTTHAHCPVLVVHPKSVEASPAEAAAAEATPTP